MLKKFFAAVLIFASLFLLAAIPGASHHTSSFPDVSISNPNYTAIEYLRTRNIISGYDDGKFRPYNDVKRSELVVMVVKAKNLDPDLDFYNKCYFDVRRQWFADEVCFAKSADWLDDYGSKFKPGKFATLGEASRLIKRAFSNIYLVFDTDSAAKIDRGEVAQLLYTALLSSGTSVSPAPSPPTTWVNPYSVNIPAGYPKPWVPSSGGPFPPVITPPPPPPPAYTSSATCQSLGITNIPTRTAATYSVNYCPLDNTGAPGTQILLGQSNLYPVWAANFNFVITEKMRAMSVAYASEMFNINPNYLNALAIKESRMDCSYYGGCFQITGGFPEVQNRYPLYFDANDSEQILVNSFETAAVIASLYIRFGEALLDSLYQFRSFYQNAADLELRVKIASRGYNRGLWDPTIRDIVQTNRASCQAQSNVFQCFPSGDITTANGIARDHAEAVTNYCRTLMASTGNFYDVRLTRQDITDFINRVLKPTFSQTALVNWSTVSQRASDAFTCLQASDDTISFRYDFKTVLQELKEVLPAVPGPVL